MLLLMALLLDGWPLPSLLIDILAPLPKLLAMACHQNVAISYKSCIVSSNVIPQPLFAPFQQALEEHSVQSWFHFVRSKLPMISIS